MATTTNNLKLRKPSATVPPPYGDPVNVVADLDNNFDAIDAASWVSVKAYGAAGDGTTDDAAAIQNALNAAALSGGTVYLPPVIYAINSPLTIPPNVALQGNQGLRVFAATDSPPVATIKLKATFVGAAAILFVDRTTGGYANESSGQRISRVNIDCSAAVGTVDGISATGLIHDVSLDHVWIWTPPRHGINTSGTHPYSWSMTRVTVANAVSIGFNLNKMTDTTMIECEAIGCGSAGYSLTEYQNGHLIACRAEFCGSGFSISGAWGTGASAGGMDMTGCSTDRNVNHGLTVTATGPGHLLVTGCTFRRDGSGGTGNGINIAAATMPVILTGVSVLPGVDDAGTGTLSPVTGVAVSGSTYVSIDNAYIHAATTPISDGGTNAVFQQANICTATGTTGSPVRATPTAVKTALQTVANTVTETVLHTFTARGGSSSIGSTYKITAWGTFGWASGTLTFALKVGGTGGVTLATATVTPTAGGNWRVDADLIVKTLGSSGVYNGVMALAMTGATPASPYTSGNGTANSGTDKDLVLTVTWSVAAAGNTISCPAAYAYRVLSS